MNITHNQRQLMAVLNETAGVVFFPSGDADNECFMLQHGKIVKHDLSLETMLRVGPTINGKPERTPLYAGDSVTIEF